MALSDKSEYKYTIETSNDNQHGVFKVRVILRSDELKITKTLEEANKIKIEEKEMSQVIAELVDSTYKELQSKGFRTEVPEKSSTKTKKMETPVTTTRTEKTEPTFSEEGLKDKSLLLD